MIYKSYPKCPLATFISLLGGFCGIVGLYFVVELFTHKAGLPLSTAVIGLVICAALFLGLRKLADSIAEKKYRKIDADEENNDR